MRAKSVTAKPQKRWAIIYRNRIAHIYEFWQNMPRVCMPGERIARVEIRELKGK